MKKTLLSAPSNFSKFYSRVLFLLLLIGGTATTQAQVSSYVFSETTGATYTDLTTGTVIASGTFASIPSYATYTLPFTFYYNNVGYTSVSMSDNGFIALGSPAGVVGNTAPISGSTDNVISCYGINLVGVAGTAEIKYDVLGSGTNRVFVIQYKDVQRKPTLAAAYTGLMNMQIRLYETTGVIETIYGNGGAAFSSATATSAYGQVGLRSSTAGDFNTRKNISSVWVASAAGNGTATTTENVQTSNTIGYAAGTKYTWTPCFNLSSIVAVTPDNSTLNFSWTAPNVAPVGGYDWEVRTSGNPGSGGVSPILFASGNTSSNSVSVLGMSIGVTYYVYVKANCRSVWLPTNTAPSSVSVTPICTVASLPYSQTFEGVVVTANTNNSPQPNNTVVGGYPACNSLVTTSGASMGVTNNSTLGYYGFNNKNLITTGNAAQNAWYFTQVINFPSAGSYRLSYKYGGSREQSFFQQKMKVYYGSAASVAGMTTLLADHPDIKTSPNTNIVNFTVSAPGNYYIGFYAYAIASQGFLQVDDITVDYSTCVAPTSLTSGQITAQTAIIAWAAAAGSPSQYDYYVSTSNVAPLSTANPTGFTTLGNVLAQLNGLTPATTYYFWVRSHCSTSPDEASVWSAISSFTTPVLLTYCNPSGATFSQDPNGITNVTMGSINNTTGIEANNYGNYSSLSTNVAQNDVVPVAITYRTGFTYETMIWVDWNNDGDFVDAGEMVYSGVSGSASPTTLNATFTVPAGAILGPHRLRIGGIDDGVTFPPPLTPCRSGQYQAFEDYTIYVTVPPPALTISDGTPGSYSNTICAGDTTAVNVTLTSAVGNYQVYTWTPNTNISGNITSGGVTFNPTTTTTYILTASQTSGNFSSKSVSYTVIVNPLPTPISVLPAAPTMCASDAPLQLVASGGTISGVVIMSEDFNGVTNTFTTVNNSTPAAVTGTNNPADAAWTIHPSPFNYSFFTFSSNDNSQFYLSNSDDQGSSGTTNTELISPVFSLVGYSDANLSFWHHYRGWSSGTATAEISLDGGTTYTVLPGTSWTTVTQGNTNGFVNVVISLASYATLGNTNSNVKIRFKYANAQFGWFWAIDNVQVTGSNSSNVYWSPNTNLYKDLACTLPYGGELLSTVYFKPGTTTSYDLESDSPDGCSSYGAITVTVKPSVPGTTSGNQFLNCSSTPADITLSGYIGSVVKWQYSSSPTFASGIIDIPNTTATLTAAEIGNPTTNTYYRAVVLNNGCTGNSTISGIIVTKTIWNGSAWSNGTPDSTKAVEFQGNYPAGTGSVAACSVLVSTGAQVFFASNETLTVQGEVRVNAACSLNFANNSSLIQVLDVANAANSYNGNGGVVSPSNGNQGPGQVVYTRTTPGVRLYDYTYWSTPVFAQTLTNLSPGSPYLGFYHWNSTTQAWNWINPVSNMTPAKGYIVRAPLSYNNTPQTYTATFRGVANSGTIPFTAPAGAANLNLVGNPYPSAIDAYKFIDVTNVNNNHISLGGTLYFWTHNTDINAGQYTGNDYASFNGSGGVAANTGGAVPSGIIGSGVGFFVKSSAVGGTGEFKNSMRVAGPNTEFFKSSSSQIQNELGLERHRYWLDVTNTEGAFKQALVAYVETATTGIDRIFDGELVDVGNVITLYTLADDNKLTIQGRPLPFDVEDTVPLGYKSTITGDYTIKLSNYDGMFSEGQNVYLEDKLLNVIHNLNESDYTFTTEIGTFEDRFVLRYSDTALGVDEPNFNENTVIVYHNNTGLHINSGFINIKNATIFDIRGRQIAGKINVANTETVFTNLPEAHQVLLVKIEGENGKTVTKKVVY